MQFSDFAASHGLIIDTPVVGKLTRCPTQNRPRSKNGAYFFDGSWGWVQAHDGDGELHKFKADGSEHMLPAQRRRAERVRSCARQEQERRNRKAACQAQQMIVNAMPKRHDYLIRKGFPDAMGLVMEDGALMIPMRHAATNEALGAQLIRWNPNQMEWEKRMLPGTRAKFAAFAIGPRRASLVVLCEGYATGLSIQKSAELHGLQVRVAVCFSAFNLEPVARTINSKGAPMLVFADNDESGTGELAAAKTGLPFCMSPVVGEDANDLHQRAGASAVVELIQKCMQSSREVSKI